jgi:preprotein translocase subunit SecA
MNVFLSGRSWLLRQWRNAALPRALRSMFDRDRSTVERIRAMQTEFARLNDAAFRDAASKADTLPAWFALSAAAASRVLGQEMYDVQVRGALALARGAIAEMQTGEGKTLAAVPAISWFARQHRGVHVMTVNDYLARRDAAWMGGIYRLLGLSVAHVQQGMTAAERRAAYAADITYATQNEIGFDYLRDRIAMRQDEQVHRPFHAVVIDEADSILIDEARVPLVIAGGESGDRGLAYLADQIVRGLAGGTHYTIDPGAHNVALTDAGIHTVETALACGSLFDVRNLAVHEAVQEALHAHALLHRDVDYIVKNGAIEMVDEFKGRIALDRRWPAGLHTAIEAKEGVAAKSQGMILGQITLQHLVALYPTVCGMTATASSQSLEFGRVYGLQVETIPPNRSMIRVDHPDVVFATKAEKERSLVEEIRRVHATGRPVLVGTASVADSERLSGLLTDLPHDVLNARHDEREAAIIARAGERGAVTVSTNMAGRGTDIRLGEGVAQLGGLYVIGANKHESRRIDNQLRGRAGRQGDPGSSRFFISLEDNLMVRYGDLDPRYREDPDTLQRLIEGQHLDTRIFLHGYEVPFEGQRNKLHTWRQEIVEGDLPEREKHITLRTIDDLWADHLARASEYRAGAHWVSWGGFDPHREYLLKIDEWFREMEAAMPGEIARRMESGAAEVADRGAVWTYLTTDQPFGRWKREVGRRLPFAVVAYWGMGA